MTKTLIPTTLAASLRRFVAQGGGKVPFRAKTGLKSRSSEVL